MGALQLWFAGYTVGIVRFTQAAAVERSRPKGVSLASLAICVLAVPAARTLAGQFHAHSLGIYYGGLILALQLYVAWSYWKGYPWARVLVLIASFLIVAGEVSDAFERGNLIALMSHPLLFLRFVLAAFLLYWLNTPPLRAWFKNTPTAADLIGQRLVGRLCISVEEVPNEEWHLAFEHDAELTLNCSWRIVLDDNLAFASNASGDSVSESPAGVQQPWQLLQNLRVKAVRIKPRTSDLFIAFEMGFELQSWSVDPRLQQWKFSDSTLTVIADPVGVNLQVIAAPVSGEDPAEND
jgi:hypothetical protein